MDPFAQAVAECQAYLFNESEDFHYGNDWPPEEGKNWDTGASSSDYHECPGTNGAATVQAYIECEHFDWVDSNHEMQRMQNLAHFLAREAEGECSYARPPGNFNKNPVYILAREAEVECSYARPPGNFNENENFNHVNDWLPKAKGIRKAELVSLQCQAHNFNEGENFNHGIGWLPNAKGTGKKAGDGTTAAIGQAYYFNECEYFDRDNLSALTAVSSPNRVTIVHEQEMHRHCEISNAHSGAIVAIAMQEQGIYTASEDKTLKRWKPEKDATGRFHLREDLKLVLEEACSSLCCIGGFIFCGLRDGSVEAFSQDGLNHRLCGHSKRVTAIIQHQTLGQSILITGSADRDVRFWKMEPGTKTFVCSYILKNCMQGSIWCLCVLGENLWIGGRRGIALCNLGSLKVAKLLLPMSSVGKLSEFQEHIVAAYDDGTIRVFDRDGNQKSEMPALAAGPIVSIGCLEAGHRLLCGHLDGQVSTTDSIGLPNFVFKTQFQAFKDISVDSLFCLGQDDLFLIGSKSGSLQMWQKIASLDEASPATYTKLLQLGRGFPLDEAQALRKIGSYIETASADEKSLGSLACFLYGDCMPCSFAYASRGCGKSADCQWCHVRTHRLKNPNQHRRRRGKT